MFKIGLAWNLISGLYVISYGYKEIGRFLNGDGMLGDAGDILSTNMYAYCANNPVMYTDSDGFCTEWLEDVGRFLGGVLITLVAAAITIATSPLQLVPVLSSAPQSSLNMTIYGAMLVASVFSSAIKSDMELISWNPYNDDANAASQSNDISFYKGVFVYRFGDNEGGGLTYFSIGLGRGNHTENTLMHEYGHYKQQQLLEMGLYTGLIAIPSLISAIFTPEKHNSQWFERWATDWGNGGWVW